MVGATTPSEEKKPFRIEKSKEGFSITRAGRSFHKKAAFGDAISKIWSDVSSKPSEGAKQRHFQRMVQLSAGLEQALASESSLSEEESRNFESARKTTIATALRMISDEDGRVNFEALDEHLAADARDVKKKDAKAKIAQAQKLSQTAALLCEAVRTEALSEKADVHKALVSAKVALTQALSILSSVDPDVIPERVAAELFERIGRLTTEIEKAQHTEPPLTAQELTVLEIARSSLVASALRMISNEEGHLHFAKVQEDIVSIAQSGRNKEAQKRTLDVRRLTHMASLLCEVLSLNSSVGLTMEGIQALTLCKISDRCCS